MDQNAWNERLRYGLWCLPRNLREAKSALKLLGAYRQRGWFESVARSAPVDRRGAALPWLTYPAIDWLESVLRPEDRIFEYGMGGSTLWFSERVAQVTSVDQNAAWVKRFSLPANVTVKVATCQGDMVDAPEGDAYVEAICESGRPFDIVLVDGMARLSCVQAAHKAVTSSGLIILDNSDVPPNRPAFLQLADWGYSQIDFCGTRPFAHLFACTSVFSRTIDQWLRRARTPRYWGRAVGEFDWRSSG